MGDEKVSEYEQISEPDQGEVAAEEVVKDWPVDVELGAVDPTADEPIDDPAHTENRRSAVVLDEDDVSDDDEDVEEL